MRTVMVPNYVSDAINAKLDEKFSGISLSPDERETHYQTLLEFFDRHGTIPDFEVKKQEPRESGERK